MNRVPHRSLVLTGMAVGLIIRVLTVGSASTPDMSQYISWGTAVLDNGLVHAFQGIYFPVQYQIFGICAWMAREVLMADPEVTIKIANLLFDVGLFTLLWVSVPSFGRPAHAALWYWLHPWFLTIFAFGYVDAQFAFFVLLTLWMLQRRSDVRGTVIAGIPFAAACLMKPQTLILVGAVALVGLLGWNKGLHKRAGALLAPAGALFLAYTLYFGFSLVQEQGIRAFFVLPFSYMSVGYVMPALTAHMPNLWYPVAYALLPPGETDILKALAAKVDAIPFGIVGGLATVALLVFYVSRLLHTLGDTPDWHKVWWNVFLVPSLIMPFVMIAAHENHFFLASVLLLPFVSAASSRKVLASLHGLYALLWVNMFLLYSSNPVGKALGNAYSLNVRLVVAVAASACFITLLVFLFHHTVGRNSA
ncbi:MAG: hypothetical protein HRF44_11305 [Ignavibacterium sp.]|jgi:hypothetical protein